MKTEQLTLKADPSRRTVLTGAAWSVPIIATTMAAPLAVASQNCPELLARVNWSDRNRIQGPGLVSASASGPYAWSATTAGLPYFVAMSDNYSTTVWTVHEVTATFDVVQGESYDFSFGVTSNYGSGGMSNSQRIEVIVGGETLYQGATRLAPAGFVTLPRVSSPPTSSNITFTNVPLTYVASQTGTVTFTYRLSLAPRADINDDIYFTTPTFAC